MPKGDERTGNAPEFFRKVIENLHDRVHFVDPERRITYWNRGAERISGYAAQDVTESRCFDEILMHVGEPKLRVLAKRFRTLVAGSVAPSPAGEIGVTTSVGGTLGSARVEYVSSGFPAKAAAKRAAPAAWRKWCPCRSPSRRT
ncbi:MAG: PAS domain S-box protein [Thermoanaerobaculaceae bacterium]|jgi:PAS domain-containing protein